MSPHRHAFLNFHDIHPRSFDAANKNKFFATGQGDMIVSLPHGSESTEIQLTSVLYAPDLAYTLVSVGCLDDVGYSVTFRNGQGVICDKDDTIIRVLPKTKGLYWSIHETSVSSSGGEAHAIKEKLTFIDLHCHMRHIAPEAACHLVINGFVDGIELEDIGGVSTFCESCVFSKAKCKSVLKEREGQRKGTYREDVYSNLWGPSSTATIGGKWYFVSFMDDGTHDTHAYLLRSKDKTFQAYKGYESWVNTQMQVAIKILHSDQGGEYLSEEFTQYLKSQGTEQKLTVHDTPEENEVTEKLNHTLLEKVHAMLHDSSLPKFLWGEALLHVVWLKNQTSTKALAGITPHEAVTGKKPNLAKLPIWGCQVWVHDN